MKLVASVLILLLLGFLVAAVTMDETECTSTQVRLVRAASNWCRFHPETLSYRFLLHYITKRDPITHSCGTKSGEGGRGRGGSSSIYRGHICFFEFSPSCSPYGSLRDIRRLWDVYCFFCCFFFSIL